MDWGWIAGGLRVDWGGLVYLLGGLAVFCLPLGHDFRYFLSQCDCQNFRPSTPFIILKGKNVRKGVRLDLLRGAIVACDQTPSRILPCNGL